MSQPALQSTEPTDEQLRLIAKFDVYLARVGFKDNKLLTVDAICEGLGIGDDFGQLKQATSAYSGQIPSLYIQSKKMGLARELFGSGLAALDVGSYLGYDDESSLRTFFRKTTSLSPKEVREQHLQSINGLPNPKSGLE